MNIGDRVGDYEIVQLLGVGGMGEVYKVRNVLSDRIEAMKVLLKDLESEPGLPDRFLREIRVQAALDHPNIAKLNTAMRIGNQLVMIMEFVEGTSVAQILEHGAIPVEYAVPYTAQVLDALAYAHEHGIVHRDIKPANIMVTPQGVVKLMDFGIARIKADQRLTQAGVAVGSLLYMSPEQIRGQQLDGRADIYSLGITVYEMVTGRRPFMANSDFHLMTAHLEQTPVPPIEIDPGVPEGLNEIILMAIAKDPDQRFQGAGAMRGALGSLDIALPAAMSRPTSNVGTPPVPLAAPPSVQTPRANRLSAAPPTEVHPTLGRGADSNRFDPNQDTRTIVPLGPPAAPSAPPSAGYAYGQSGVPSSGPSYVPPAASAPYAPPAMPQPGMQAGPQPGMQAAMPPMPPPSTPQKAPGSRRGLYMALGSLATIAVLVAAVIYVPKLYRGGTSQATTTSPGTGSTTSSLPDPSTTKEPTTTSANPSSTPASGATTSKHGVTATSPNGKPNGGTSPDGTQGKGTTGKTQTTAQNNNDQGNSNSNQGNSKPADTSATQTAATQVVQTNTQTAAPAPNAAEMKELRQKFNALSIRASAAKDGLGMLEQRQRSQGWSLRGDIFAARTSLDYQLQEAAQAMSRGDVDEAKQAIQYGEGAAAKIEKFLGQ